MKKGSIRDSEQRSRVLSEIACRLESAISECIGAHFRAANSLGLTLSDALAIHFLDQNGPATASKLASVVRLTAASVTSLLDRLEQKQIVSRVHDTVDRRKILVKMSDQSSWRNHRAGQRKGLEQILATCSTAELSILADVLGRMQERGRDLKL